MTEKVKPEENPSYTLMTGEVYDLIYSNKDYEAEANRLMQIVREKAKSGGNQLLEAACGTGNYLKFFQGGYSVEGFDLSAEQVADARKKLPGIRIEQADMVNFDMGKQYDAVMCLFSSIGYLKTIDNLNASIATMAKHTKPGGVVIIEPWLKPDKYIDGHVSVEGGSNDHMSVVRMNKTTREGIVTTLNLHHMVGTAQGIEHFIENHELAMFSDQNFADAFSGAGLTMEIDEVGLRSGRGLYIGNKPT